MKISRAARRIALTLAGVMIAVGLQVPVVSAEDIRVAETSAKLGGADASTTAEEFGEQYQQFSENWSIVTGARAARYAADFKRNVELQSGERFDRESVEVWTDGERVMVRSDLEGENLVGPSGVSIFYANNGDTVQIEMVYSEIDATSGTVDVWQDGAHVVSETVTADMQTQGWNEFIDCLNNNGAAGWLITAITISCSAICVGTVGLGCPVCITAAAGFAGGVVGHCIDVALW